MPNNYYLYTGFLHQEKYIIGNRLEIIVGGKVR